MSVFASRLLGNFFGTEEMRRIFSDDTRLRNYLRIEVALARVEAALGVIPADAYPAIAAAAETFTIDWDRWRSDIEAVGYPVLPFLRQFGQACGPASEYLHWGSTTRDITDTSLALQMQDGLALVQRDMRLVKQELVRLTRQHRDTIMIARTHGMHALPTTFGFRTGIWLSEVERQLERLAFTIDHVRVGQFGGAVGTLAAVGEQGLAVQHALMAELGLKAPDISWFASRDRIAQAAFALAQSAATMASIAKTIVVMTRNEVGEAREPEIAGRGTSSAMPHKHNTVASELVLACGRAAAQNVSLVMESMVQDYDRDWQGHFETIALPQTFLLAHAAVTHMLFVLRGLTVHEGRMRENIELTNGLVMAESVMMALAGKVGRRSAQALVAAACDAAIAGDRHLRDVLLGDPRIAGALSAEEISAALEPANYLGEALHTIDGLLAGDPA
jgi:3-carboxy-cis,cis-muconate cycloisomerase